MLLFAGSIGFKVVHIQFFSDKDWKETAEQLDVKLKTLPANRGNIYDESGALLATSLPFYYVAFDPSISNKGEERTEIFEEGIDSLSFLLSSFFRDRSPHGYESYIRDAVKNKKQYLKLNSDRVNYHDKKMMETWPIFRKGQMKGGVLFEKVDRRDKPFGHLASKTIGYLQEDGSGRNGVEYSFDSLLTGTDGMALFANFGSGKWKPLNGEQGVKPEDGLDVVTTINVNVQDITEYALLKALEYDQADHGCAIVMEVATGEIKAMANLDKRVVKDRVTGEDRIVYSELINRAVTKSYEPGSTFKLASMMAVLEKDKNLHLTDVIDCSKYGHFKFYDRMMYDSHPIGKVSLEKVFAYSSNIGVAKLANRAFNNSRDAQNEYSELFSRFGLRDDLDFQLIGAPKPFIRKPGDQGWSGTSVPWMSHGYGLHMTPLQVLTFYNAVANNGTRVQPILVKEIRRADEVIEAYEAKVDEGKICSERTLKMVRSMLKAVTSYGTAKKIKSEEYLIAGKTGTAKKIEDGLYTKKYIASFAGYFPADNPKYSIMVVIDNPSRDRRNRYSGGVVAAPVFKEIADKIYHSDMALHASLPSDYKKKKDFPEVKPGYHDDITKVLSRFGFTIFGDDETGEWVSATGKTELKGMSLEEQKVVLNKVPNVKGMSLRDALPLLENLGLTVRYEGRGIVASQSLAVGKEFVPGDQIKVVLKP
jgi:cell division protein FtsI (penicillin-binding protein 3)